MAMFLQEKFKTYKDFNVITSAFEDIPLEEDYYDLIYAASAFHWVDAKVGCPKVLRLLKNGGIVALLRYNFNVIPADGEDLYKEIQAIYRNYYCSYYTSKNIETTKMTKEKFEKSPQILSGYGFEDLGVYGFSDATMNLYDAIRTYNADEWITFIDTMSDHRNLPDSNRSALYAGVKEVILNHGGQHKVNYVFQLYMGRK